MYRTLFELAGIAIVGWLPLIFLPRWRVSVWLSKSLVAPVYLSLLYLIGIVPIVVAAGPRIMADFGNLSGVLSLLAREEVALIAWIHILAFDQLVGLLIYRHNMKHRTVPLPVQSLILFLCLMFGPVGFLTYGLLYLVRRPWRSSPRGAEVHPTAISESSSSVDQLRSATTGVLRHEPLLAALGLAGVVLGVLCLAAIPFVGAQVPPEGTLRDTASFNVGVGLFTLTLAAILPLAHFSVRGARRWRITMSGLVVYFYAIETVQAFRGLDPRFTQHGGLVDQVSGALFGMIAVAMIVVTLILAAAFFRRGSADLLTFSIRYGFAAVAVAFAVGLWMSAIRGRQIGAAGDLLVSHGFGFHGIQAVPLIALLLRWSGTPRPHAERMLHVAGIAWLAGTLTLVLQAAIGEAPFAPTVVSGIAALALGIWVAVLVTVSAAYVREQIPADEVSGSTSPS